MKGILLAGGRGTRLYPITKVVNKHLLPVFDRPMLFYPLQALINSGLKEITIVQGPPFGEQVKVAMADFRKPKGMKISFVYQPQPAGMADAIKRCKKFADGKAIMVIAGDNIFGGDFKKEISDFEEGALSFLRKVKDPQRHGVPIYKNKKLIKIEEKPKKPMTDWVVTGPHIFDASVFEKINVLKPSRRGELEITDLNSLYLKTGQLQLIKRRDFWRDVGTFDSLLQTGNYLRRMRDK